MLKIPWWMQAFAEWRRSGRRQGASGRFWRASWWCGEGQNGAAPGFKESTGPPHSPPLAHHQPGYHTGPVDPAVASGVAVLGAQRIALGSKQMQSPATDASSQCHRRGHVSHLVHSPAMASILVPFAYLIIVFGGLLIFSHYYRKHTSSPYTISNGF